MFGCSRYAPPPKTALERRFQRLRRNAIRTGSPSERDSAIRKLFEEGISDKRGEHYGALLSRVRRLAAHAAHEFDKLPFSRAEARLIASMTANLVALIASTEQESPKK